VSEDLKDSLEFIFSRFQSRSASDEDENEDEDEDEVFAKQTAKRAGAYEASADDDDDTSHRDDGKAGWASSGAAASALASASVEPMSDIEAWSDPTRRKHHRVKAVRAKAKNGNLYEQRTATTQRIVPGGVKHDWLRKTGPIEFKKAPSTTMPRQIEGPLSWTLVRSIAVSREGDLWLCGQSSAPIDMHARLVDFATRDPLAADDLRHRPSSVDAAAAASGDARSTTSSHMDDGELTARASCARVVPRRSSEQAKAPRRPLIPALRPVRLSRIQLLTVAVRQDVRGFRMKRALLALMRASPVLESSEGHTQANLNAVVRALCSVRLKERVQAPPDDGIVFHVVDEDEARDAIVILCAGLQSQSACVFARGMCGWFSHVPGKRNMCEIVAAPVDSNQTKKKKSSRDSGPSSGAGADEEPSAGFEECDDDADSDIDSLKEFRIRVLEVPQSVESEGALEKMTGSVRPSWDVRPVDDEERLFAAKVVASTASDRIQEELVANVDPDLATQEQIVS
jgi:hypothetical protein